MQTQTTTVIKRTLNPYWNESFDVYVPTPKIWPFDITDDLKPGNSG